MARETHPSMDRTWEIRRFLDTWADTSRNRNVEAAADLYLRQPAPSVVFSDGARAEDWLDVRVRLDHDLSRVSIENVELHDVQWTEVADDVLACSFLYELHVRDLWGMPLVASRVASMTLVRTKDGLRIAAAHFSPAA